MTITLDKILTCSLSEFMDHGDNHQKYKDYDLKGVHVMIGDIGNTNELLNKLLNNSGIPTNIELIIDFKYNVVKNGSDHSRTSAWYSGIALVPKPNNIGGSNVNN